MKLHQVETDKGLCWIAIVGGGATEPSEFMSVAIARGLWMEAAIAAAHVRRVCR